MDPVTVAVVTVGVGAAAKFVFDRLGISIDRHTELRHERKLREESRLADELDMRTHAHAEEQIMRERLGRAAAQLYWQEGNIESIGMRAASLIPDDTDVDLVKSIDDSWFSTFREGAKHESDPTAQELWAKLLAGETQAPGTFSKRTLEALRTLSQAEAQALSTLYGFATGKTPDAVPLIFDPDAAIYRLHGITRASLLTLQEAGLITYLELGTYWRELPAHGMLTAEFGQVTLVVGARGTASSKSGNTRLGLGKTIFTSKGNELGLLIAAPSIKGFPEYVAEVWGAEGHPVTIVQHE